MVEDQEQELQALVVQAARNLRTLEDLIRSVEGSSVELGELQRRVRRLQQAYVRETDALTRQVIRRAIERRTGDERRKDRRDQPIGT